MSTINVGRENSEPVELYYEDHGSGTPVVLIHGFPLSGRSWERQTPALLNAGYRVITYDRRGFGDSSKPTCGYNYETFTNDLHALMTALDLRGAALVGFSMGTGEVAHYLGRYGSDRVTKAVFISSILPYLARTPENPAGMDNDLIEQIRRSIAADRLAYLADFLANFYNVDVYRGARVSDEVVRFGWNVAAAASPIATSECVLTWTRDFRADVSRINVPTLIIHGDDDRILPFAATAVPLHRALKGSQLIVIERGPHGLIWTHADQVNPELVGFLRQTTQARAA